MNTIQRIRDYEVGNTVIIQTCFSAVEAAQIVALQPSCLTFLSSSGLSYEPHHKKTCLQGFPAGKTQTGLLS